MAVTALKAGCDVSSSFLPADRNLPSAPKVSAAWFFWADVRVLRTPSHVKLSLAAAMAKLACSEMAGRVTDGALQIHGGYGYTRDLPLERLVRDARILRIYEGTSQIMQLQIAKHLLREFEREGAVW